MPRDEIVAKVAAYAERIGAPVELDTDARRVALDPRRGFEVQTDRGTVRAREVIVATGPFQVPRIPEIAAALPDRLMQLHSHDYKNEPSLPPGAVLVVGSAQSGVQIAEELAGAGRRVYLSVGTAGRVPRRYRGRDFFRWAGALAARGEAFGTPLPTADKLPDPRMRSAGNPHLSGHDGGHDTNLRQFAASGMTLLGRIEAVDGERLRLAPDLATSLARADGFFDERFRPSIDTYIERAGIEAPPDDRVPVAFDPPELAELDLAAEGIAVVIWATGYRRDYGWIEPLAVDEQGFPRQRRGVTDVPGLYFIGSLWQHTQASATLFGVSLDARALAEHMGLGFREDALPVVP
jgi:putative flavoprotein involved in K+ transport